MVMGGANEYAGSLPGLLLSLLFLSPLTGIHDEAVSTQLSLFLTMPASSICSTYLLLLPICFPSSFDGLLF
jgi:hypothetical protein